MLGVRAPASVLGATAGASVGTTVGTTVGPAPGPLEQSLMKRVARQNVACRLGMEVADVERWWGEQFDPAKHFFVAQEVARKPSGNLVSRLDLNDTDVTGMLLDMYFMWFGVPPDERGLALLEIRRLLNRCDAATVPDVFSVWIDHAIVGALLVVQGSIVCVPRGCGRDVVQQADRGVAPEVPPSGGILQPTSKASSGGVVGEAGRYESKECDRTYQVPHGKAGGNTSNGMIDSGMLPNGKTTDPMMTHGMTSHGMTPYGMTPHERQRRMREQAERRGRMTKEELPPVSWDSLRPMEATLQHGEAKFV